MRTRPYALWAVLVAGLVGSLGGCEASVDVRNAAPAVTWVAVVPVGPSTVSDCEAVSEVTVWIRDLEGDSVDLEIGWLDAAGERGVLDLEPGDYGLLGLPTRDALFEADGQPHRLLWCTDGLDATRTLRLEMTPDDRPYDGGGRGKTVQTKSFTTPVGLPLPEQVE